MISVLYTLYSGDFYYSGCFPFNSQALKIFFEVLTHSCLNIDSVGDFFENDMNKTHLQNI